MKNYVLYTHTNNINGKVYVGITMDTVRRWKNNGYEYRRSPRFYNAVKKYGMDNFTSEVIKEGLSFDEACALEIEYIEKLEATSRSKGYNISSGGNGGLIYQTHPQGMLGKPQTEYQKKVLSNLMNDPVKNPMSNGECVFGQTHKHPLSKTVVVITPSVIKVFDTIKGCANHYNLPKEQMRRVIHRTQPYKCTKQGMRKIEYRNIDGFTFEYLENTEIIDDCKKSSTS